MVSPANPAGSAASRHEQGAIRVRYKLFGRTGLRVPALCLGTMSGFLGAAAFALIAALIAGVLLPRAREARSFSPQPG